MVYVYYKSNNIDFDKEGSEIRRNISIGGCISGAFGALLLIGGTESFFNYIKNNKRITH